MAHMTTVFLSSTAKDLKPWRDAVADAISKLNGFHCVRMEDFGAVDAAPAEVCRRRVEESDVFVGLVGHLNGSRPEGSEPSYTEIEYEEAKRRVKPRLLFVADDDFPLPARLGREPEDVFQRQIRFREQVQRERTVVFFHEPDKLATLVVAALQSQEKEARADAAQREAERAKSGSVQGSGALAMGLGAVAAGEGGMAAGRDINVFHGSGKAAADEASLRQVYLRRLIAQTELLNLRGVDPAVTDATTASRLKLQALYTALLTLSPRREEEPRRGPGSSEHRGPASALDHLDGEGRLVLLGDPGSGKSTFVNFVALCLAGEALGLPDANLGVLTLPLPDDDGDLSPEPQPWSHGPLLPVHVVLRDFAVRGLPEPGERAMASHLWAFLKGELEAAGHGEFFLILRAELFQGRGLVLLDGLDEVPEADERRVQICQAVGDFARSVGRSRVVVTCRTYAYQDGAWKLADFTEAILAPFSRGQIVRFVELWYQQLVALGKLGEEEAAGSSELLRRAIFGSDRLRGLAERPLLLTLMASLHAWRGGRLPEKRVELYKDAVELLLNTWERKPGRLGRDGMPVLPERSLAEWLRADREEIRQVLEEIAFEAHGAQPAPQGTADVPEGRVVARLLHLKRNPKADAVQLAAYLRERSGLLVERRHGVYTFPHRTFQEYLAACHLTEASVPEEVARLGREEPGRWREVVLLAGAKAASGQMASAWSQAEALCYLEPGAPGTGPADEWGALLAGQMIAESVPVERVGEVHRPKLERVRRWLVHLLGVQHFPALERAEAGIALAALGDPRFDPECYELPKEPRLGFKEIPGGAFVMGSAEEDPQGYRDEQPQHEVSLPTYWLSRYPVTVAQYRAFVSASGFKPGDSGWQEGPATAPVANVSWFEALSYCQWLGERLKELAAAKRDGVEGSGGFWAELAKGHLKASLPSEAEWEKAARGAAGREYPWGSEADANRGNFAATGLGVRSPVGCFAGGASPYGCEEMSGNVWEWTRSLLRDYPYLGNDGREVLEEPAERRLRVLRGGAFYFSSGGVRCAYRFRSYPGSRSGSIGFRVVLSPFPL